MEPMATTFIEPREHKDPKRGGLDCTLLSTYHDRDLMSACSIDLLGIKNHIPSSPIEFYHLPVLQ